MAAKSSGSGWRIFRWSFIATTFPESRKSKLPCTTLFANRLRCSAVATLELFGTAGCPYTQEMREWLEWKRSEFVEYDVEEDPSARERLLALAQGQASVPVLVEDGRVIQVGWHGRSCVIGEQRSG